MAPIKSWSSKEEVLKDLARASGRRIKKKEHLDEGFLVIGDAPPPVIVEVEGDEEMQLLFGEAVCKRGSQTVDATPDLLGIQQMLRMVQDFDDGDDDIANDPASDSVIAITKVSELNPNVKEFIPKNFSLSSTNNKVISMSSKNSNKKDTSDSINVNIVTQTADVNIEDSSDVKETDVKDINKNIELDVDVSDVKINEYQDIATKLKNEISDSAKSDSFEFKKQKNVAIATLLRLYATNNKPLSTEPIKLFTPEYFEGKTDCNLEVKIEDIPQLPPAVLAETSASSSSSTAEPKNSSTSIPICSSTSISSTPLQISSEISIGETSSTSKPEIKIDPEIKRSIEKVNKWFEEPTKIKSPTVCLGPIAFNRKGPSICKSPTTNVERNTSKTEVNKKYQPSDFAANLGQKYMARNKIKEEKSKEVTWDNLEEVLKRKDLEIKKAASCLSEEQTSASESHTLDTA